ncbi:hypothetical protein SK128_005316, partial [Halocaridina rubra]
MAFFFRKKNLQALILLHLVTEAVARVLPGPEVYVQSGSRLEVICQVKGCSLPALLSWTRAGQAVPTPEAINFDAVTENGTIPVTERILLQREATTAHSGNYSCISTCTKPVNVTVHVLK